MSRVSVIVPVYNVEKYLSNCIESIINQSMQDIEIVLVNDGSKDNSGKICKDYVQKDNRIIYVEQENQGVSAARNNGKKNSTGEYIIYVDADDELNLYMLEKLYNDIKQNDADIAVSKIQKIRCKEDITANDEGQVILLEKKEALKSYLTESKLEIGVWNKLYKRTIVEDIDFYVGRKMNEDKFYAFESIMNSKKITYRNEALYYYYVRENSATKQDFDAKWFDNIFFAEKIYDRVVNEYPDLESAARYQTLITKYYLVLLMKRKKSDIIFKHEYRKLIDDIKGTPINDLTIKRKTKTGIVMIQHFEHLFNFIKKYQK